MGDDLINPVEIVHNQYEKISDDVYVLGQNMILRMNVTLGKKRKDGNRYGYHNEYMYSSNKYIDMNQLITMRRSYEYFMTIENMTGGRFENNVMIRPQDMYNIRARLDQCIRWFNDKEFENLYAISDDDKLVIVDEPKPIVIQGLAADKRIVIEPTILTYENAQLEGVRMYVNDINNFVDINVDRFMGFAYIMNTIDLFGAAQNMVSYLGRPSPEDNDVVVFSGGGDDNVLESKEGATGVRNRRVTPKGGGSMKRSKSFFDDIDNM